MAPDLVRQRITFARKRLSDLLTLNNGDLSGAPIDDRQQLVVEFFNHLVGAIDLLAQTVNQSRALGMDPEYVHVNGVCDGLAAGDPIKTKLASLYTNTRTNPFPSDPYSDEGNIYRIYNYRHQVAHRGTNPFLFRIGPDFDRERSVSLLLDPRDPQSGASSKTIQEDMEAMARLVEQSCGHILGLL